MSTGSSGPSFLFFIPGEDEQVFPGSPLWELPLAGNSSDFSKNVPRPDAAQGQPLTIGDYFTAARAFLEKEDLLARSFSAMAEKGKDAAIRVVKLFLEKHGAFYHPLRVNVLSETGRSASFVLNGAVSGPGLSLIQKEYRLLAGLEKQGMPYTPRVFGAGIQALETPDTECRPVGSRDVGFFLGEWFEGFREFHISTRDGEPQIAVWASNGDIDYFSLEKASVIYEQIAHILTCYYTVDTGEQIFPWHHAAGDFVVNPLAEDLPVRLITVRGLSALLEFDPAGPGDHVLPSLLFFFLNLTLRMQIDRMDGIGQTVFLGEQVLQATINGFLRGLDDKATFRDSDAVMDDLKATFIKFVAGFTREQIEAVQVNLIEAWPENAAEVTLANGHLKSHTRSIHSLFKNM